MANLPGWSLLVNLWLGREAGAYWLIIALLFAGQGTAPSIAPLVLILLWARQGLGDIFDPCQLKRRGHRWGILVLAETGRIGFLGFVAMLPRFGFLGLYPVHGLWPEMFSGRFPSANGSPFA